MLSKGDEYPIHQTPEPIAFSGTDRNFYDRYFFNGYQPDGTEFFAVAFGVYPHLNVADASFVVVRNGVEVALHASRWLGDRMDLTVGPVKIEILEPLNKLKVTVDSAEHGLKGEIIFTGRAFPLEEPRFIRRVGRDQIPDHVPPELVFEPEGALSQAGNNGAPRMSRKSPSGTIADCPNHLSSAHA